MRKILFNFLLIINSSYVLYAQSTDVGVTYPIPSASSLGTYINSPVSIATGIPDISFPLISASTGKIKVDFSLSYHPVNQAQKASDVGRGWTLFGASVISREIINEPDERYATGEFNDLYYYNIPGYSGKFKISRDNTDTYTLINLTPSTVKINFTRTGKKLNNFTIIDNKGYKYLFNTYGQSKYRGIVDSQEITYRSIYYLSKIQDENNNDLVTYDYDEVETKYFSGSLIESQIFKLTQVNILGVGKINLNYTYYPNEAGADPFKLNFISLNTINGKQISKYVFNNSNRVLNDIKKYGQLNDSYEITSFEYAGSDNPLQYYPDPTDAEFYGFNICPEDGGYYPAYVNPWELTAGVLSKIILPTGGVTRYIFEPHREFIDKSQPQYLSDIETSVKIDPEIQYLKRLGQVYFNFYLECDPLFSTSQNLGKQYVFEIPGNPNEQKDIYIKYTGTKRPLPSGSNTPGGPSLCMGNEILKIEAIIKKNGQPVPLYNNLCGLSYPGVADVEDALVSEYKMTPGVYTIELNGTGGYGFFDIYQKKIIPGPFKNEKISEGLGVRIKTISHYENNDYNTPAALTTSYSYNEFNNPLNSSGKYYELSSEYPVVYDSAILYKNVRVKTGNNSGYTDYTYKKMDEAVNGSAGIVGGYPYLNVTRGGLLYKKEDFDESGHKVSTSIFDPYLEQMQPAYLMGPNGVYTNTSFVKNEKTTVINYYDNESKNQQVISEATRDSDNFNITYRKVTNSDGSIDESFYKYASEKGISHLINKNILATPLETEIKRNGQTVSKSEVRYDDPNNVYPSYNLSYNLGDFNNESTAKKDIKFDLYDTKGNIVQYTTTPNTQGEGYPVTLIWGYNKTMPIVKIEGAKLSSLSAADVADIENKSNEYANASAGDMPAKESAFLSALESFRANHASLSYQITCYSYYPLIGLSQVIPPNGIKEIYEYDTMNRLKRIKNTDGVTIKEIDYNYKH